MVGVKVLSVLLASFHTVISSNFAVFVFKLLAYFHTGSASMLSETIHSLADMLNQVTIIIIMSILLYQNVTLQRPILETSLQISMHNNNSG